MAQSRISQQISEARAAGWGDEEIATYLADHPDVGYKVRSALTEGYSPQQVVNFLQQQPPEMGERIERQAGLSARNVVKGVLSPATTFIGDPLAGAMNLAGRGYEALTGNTAPRFGYPSQTVDNLLTQAGLPRPANRQERLTGEVEQIISGTGALAKGAQLLSKGVQAAPNATQRALNLLATKPGAQILSGTASATAVDAAREHGASPGAQLAIGLGAGVVSPQGGNVASELRRATQVVKPFTQPGREAIVGQALNRLATDPDKARSSLLANERLYQTPLVPGSRPTTGMLAQDAGLAGAETALAKSLDHRNLLGQRISENNAARSDVFDRMARDADTVRYAKGKRDSVTTPMRNAAFSGGVDPQALNSAVSQIVLPHIDNVLMNTPQGKRQAVEATLGWARGRLDRELNSLEDLYELRKDLREASLGKYDSEVPSARLAKKELEGVIRVVDDVIEAGAPTYRDYMRKYSRMSRPVDQMELLQDVGQKSRLAAPDPVTGREIFSQAKLKNQLQSRSEEIGQTLSATQRARVNAILADLNRAASVNSAVAKRPGSDTFKNLSIASVIGNMFSEKMIGNDALCTVARPFEWLYRLPDEKVADLLVEAMLDPALAADLMRKGSIMFVEPVSRSLRKKAVESGIVAPVGAFMGADQ